MAHLKAKRLPFLFPTLLLILQLSLSASQSVMKGGYWYSDSGLAVSDIEASLYTHLFCAFADLDPTTNRVTISSSNAPRFSTFTQTVQQKNPSVKALLSIGGGGSNKTTFSSMASQPTSRKSFIDSSIELARDNNFHGLDLDWEHPSSATDRANLGSLLTEWRATVAAEAEASGRPALLLSAAVSGSDTISSLDDYPPQEIANNLDWINVMAYDLFTPDGYSNMTQPPAPLKNPGGQFSGDEGVSKWIQLGVPNNKLALGLPFYGYQWELDDANNGGLFAPATNPEVGAVKYKDIKALGLEVKYNSTFVTNYAQNGLDWYGYDDTQTIAAKVVYAKQRGLLGYFAWQIEQDSNWTLSQTASQTWDDSNGVGAKGLLPRNKSKGIR